NNIVVNYLSWENAFGTKKKNKNLQNISIVIMAGGKGDRLAPFTKILPKPLIPINDKPVIEHIIEKFTSFGATKFCITVNYKSLILKSFFKELKPNYSVKFFEEKKPLGTIGGLHSHKKNFKDAFFVTNCDVIIDSDYGDIYNFHKSNKNDITLVASTKDFEIPYGICELNKKGKLSNINEKPRQNFLANTGLYVLNPKVLNLIPKNKFFHMTQLIKIAKKRKLLVGVYPVEDSKWVDIGQWSMYRKYTGEY
ncbi:sugar phosphate nucleotidyltransferase, partial [Pelagibacteraceae bacterium]|nr:sugar phosphate nucleotidyltransferase [Pelagibacteraceae bacterium]